MFECSREQTKPRQVLRPKRVVSNGVGGGNGPQSPSLNTSKRNTSNQQTIVNGGAKSAGNGNGNGFKDEVNLDMLDFTKKILHASWHPKENIVAIAATNNLYLYYNREVYLLFQSTF